MVASETRTETRRWTRWSGTRNDIVRIAQRIEELAAAAGFERNDARVAVEFETTKISYRNAAEAAEGLPAVDLTNLHTLSIIHNELHGFSMAVHFFKNGTVLMVEGSGDHHIKVAGIADDLAAEIGRGGTPQPPRRWGLLAALYVISVACLVLSNTLEGTVAKVLAVVAIAACLVGVWLFTIPLFPPRREILAEGQRNRAERLRGSATRFAGWAVTLGAGAVLGVLATKWLG